MDQREEFVRLAVARGANRSELCRRFGISRETGYKWLRRCRAEGGGGLADQSRRLSLKSASVGVPCVQAMCMRPESSDSTSRARATIATPAGKKAALDAALTDASIPNVVLRNMGLGFQHVNEPGSLEATVARLCRELGIAP